jgi:DNA-binding NarL/FixJ family response regulator
VRGTTCSKLRAQQQVGGAGGLRLSDGCQACGPVLRTGAGANMARLLIVDDHEVIRAGLRAVLEPRWEIVGEAADGRTAIRKALELRPDVIILDYALPLINGLEAARQIRMRLPTSEIIIFTMREEQELIRDLLEAGVRGYVLKSDAGTSLINAVEAALEHRPFFTANVSEELLHSFLSQARHHLLTARELSIVQMVAQGSSNKQIADTLGISRKTVESDRASAMRKLNVTTAAKLVRYAVRNKLVDPA